MTYVTFAAFPTFAVFAESQVAGEQPEAFIRRGGRIP